MPNRGMPVRKCRSCGSGLIVRPRAFPPGAKAEVIPAETWREMEAMWEREFGSSIGSEDDEKEAFDSPVGTEDEDEDVRAQVADMQRFLVGRGYKIKVDGWRGPETEAAVDAYHGGVSPEKFSASRSSVGIEDDDEDEETDASPAPSSVPAEIRAHVASMQQFLAGRGYDIKVDGWRGPETSAALADFHGNASLEDVSAMHAAVSFPSSASADVEDADE
jgi:hypothetical protein